MGTRTEALCGPEGRLSSNARGAKMSIEALMSAVDAAGYVMVAEDDLPETFGETTAPVAARTALTVWEPVLAAAAVRPTWSSQVSTAWSWVSHRFVSGHAA